MKKLSVFALLIFSVFTVHAGTVALTGFTSGGLAYAGSDQLYGWFFDTSADITVTDLGVFDSDEDGLVVAHDVGIFRVSDQALMGSASLPAGNTGTLFNSFRYVPTTPFLLVADSYVIVMTMPSVTTDYQYIQTSSVSTSSPVTWKNSAFDAGSSIAYPTQDGSAFNQGMFGPNFQFDAAQAPEPGSALLFAAGGLGLAMLRRRRPSNS